MTKRSTANAQCWDRTGECLMSLDDRHDRRAQLKRAVEVIGAAMGRAGHGADWIAENMAELAGKFVEAVEKESIEAAAQQAHGLVGKRSLEDDDGPALCEDNR